MCVFNNGLVDCNYIPLSRIFSEHLSPGRFSLAKAREKRPGDEVGIIFFTRVNKIEAMYGMSRVNDKVAPLSTLRLFDTFQTLSLLYLHVRL